LVRTAVGPRAMVELSRQQDRRSQNVFYSALCLFALAFTVIVLPSSSAHFHRFFGSADPRLVVAAASVIGAAALWALLSRFDFAILLGRATLPGIGFSALLATALGVAIVIADLLIRYPEDMNVPVR